MTLSHSNDQSILLRIGRCNVHRSKTPSCHLSRLTGLALLSDSLFLNSYLRSGFILPDLAIRFLQGARFPI
jgi:hypothetical protein